MMWIILSFLTAFFESAKDVASKRSMRDVNEYLAAFSSRALVLPFILPVVLFVGIPAIDPGFMPALLVCSCINAAGLTLYMKAIKSSDLSITAPMIAFTPIFLMVTSPLIMSEYPSGLGALGIALIVAGSYVLHIRKASRGFLSPFRSLLKEKGPRYMLLVAFLWSIGANFDKIGVQNSDPYFWILSVAAISSFLMLPMVALSFKSGSVRKRTGPLVQIGLFSALTMIFQMNALLLAIVPYVISIKRTSVIMSVLWGAVIFREKHVRGRLLGALIMVVGVALVMLF